jgi:hypothetical protein
MPALQDSLSFLRRHQKALLAGGGVAIVVFGAGSFSWRLAKMEGDAASKVAWLKEASAEQAHRLTASLFPDSANPDFDGDGLPDAWEREFFGDLVERPGDDADHDGLANGLECSPDFAFSAEKVEIARCLTPTSAGWTDPTNPDTDGDGTSDGDEFWGRGGAAEEKIERPFADVAIDHPFFREIRQAKKSGWLPPFLAGEKFLPEEKVARADLMRIFSAFSKKEKGVPAGLDPSEKISRLALALFLSDATEKPLASAKEKAGVAPSDLAASWEGTALVKEVVGGGILDLLANDSFQMNRLTTRGEVVAALVRMKEKGLAPR